ncbi:MAG TPA: VirB4 family type IV secretion/conjugal transfer ATPase [Candidatus Babeliales bacterium]|nr:VirB4 family type IV secretion/conjugal transfer ATPase [Candidatus Babeliales bacterium]
MPKFKLNRAIKSEEPASIHINVISHYDNDTLLDKSGKLIKIMKVSGLNYFTKDVQTLDAYKKRRNHLFKSFSSEFAFYFWEIRRKVNKYLTGEFSNSFAKTVNDKYFQAINDSEMFHTELYLAVMAKNPEGLINKGFAFLKQFIIRFDKAAKQEYLAKRHKELNEATLKVLSALSDYNCKILHTYENKGVKFSEPLAFLSQLINFDSLSVPLKIRDASTALPRKRLFFNGKSGTIEIRAADNSKKFASMLSIKAYSPITYQGILNEISSLKCEFNIIQSFRPYDRQVAKGRLRDQQMEMLQSKEESISQTEEIDDVFDDTASGQVGYGKHHLSITCFADSQEELNKHISHIVSRFADVDIACVREDVACEMSYWAQLPGNFRYICREADISTLNMSGFVSLYNYPLGKAKNNHWGDAVTVLETLSGSPYYFNFHHKDVGNFIVYGAMGSGKTLLVGFLILQSMKFGGKRIFFDKDRGMELMVHFMRGVYDSIKPGRPTGFNPCQLENTPDNRKFLATLFNKMLTINGQRLTEADTAVIDQAIEGMYRMDKASRQLCHLASFFGARKPGSLRARFDQWHGDGTHAWLFDNEHDNLNLDPDVIGFDLGSILADKECKTPALMYLLHRIEQSLAGQRGVIFIDEAWKVIDDDYLKSFVNDSSRTFRKKNIILGLATQVANDTVDLANCKAINESAFCKIFFPNPSADRRVYIDALGLSEREFDQIKKQRDDENYFLSVHGQGVNKESVFVRANLKKMKQEIAVISGRENTLGLFDQIRSEVGDDPELYLPEFNKRVEAFL